MMISYDHKFYVIVNDTGISLVLVRSRTIAGISFYDYVNNNDTITIVTATIATNATVTKGKKMMMTTTMMMMMMMWWL